MSTMLDQPVPRSRGFLQLFGLEPRIAVLTFVVDTMLFGGTILSFGLLIPVAMLAGVVLGLITYRAQMRWYGDDREAAMIKGLIIGLLTAIPTPLPVWAYLPAAVIGLLNRARHRLAR